MIRAAACIVKKPGREFEITRKGSKIMLTAKKKEEKKGRHKTLLRNEYPPAFKIKIPKNRREMLKSEYKEEFLIAEGIELETVQKQDTVTFVKEDKTKHKLKTRMIFLCLVEDLDI